MLKLECSTYQAAIYIAGDIETAKQVIRKYCRDIGLCVAIKPTLYIFTMGEQMGYEVGFINYPRFPKSNDEIFNTAKTIGELLLNETYQGSFTIVATDRTEFYSRRTGD